MIAGLRTTSNSLVAVSFSLLIHFLELATELVCTTLQFARYSVHLTKNFIATVRVVSTRRYAVMFAATDSSNEILLITTVSSRQALMGITTACLCCTFSTWDKSTSRAPVSMFILRTSGNPSEFRPLFYEWRYLLPSCLSRRYLGSLCLLTTNVAS